MATPSDSSRHSPFAPSASHRWLECPGSVTLEAQFPDKGAGFHAQWGSAAHLLGEMRLKKVLTAEGLTQTIGKKIREIAPLLDEKENDFLDIEVDEEMIWVVQEYVIFCQSLMSPMTEEKVEVRVTTDIDPTVSGTLDFLSANWPETLDIVDLKTGAGNQVEAVDNSQLAIYGLGALNLLGTDFETIRMTIFQPRGEGKTVRQWEMPVKDFVKVWRKKIEKGFKRAKRAKKTYVPGDHCKWCKGILACPKAKKEYKAMLKTANDILEPPASAKELARVLSHELVILEYLNRCKATAFEMLNAGVEVPGFKLVQTWGRENWTDEDKVRNSLDSVGFYVEQFENKKLKTPKQVRKILGRHYPAELDKFTMTKSNGAKLVPVHDPRPAFVPAAEAFKND